MFSASRKFDVISHRELKPKVLKYMVTKQNGQNFVTRSC